VGNKTAQTIGSEKRCFSQLFLENKAKAESLPKLESIVFILLCETQRFKSLTAAIGAVCSDGLMNTSSASQVMGS
jgi:hypothetical protein